jgi:hypothetical protein
MVILLILPSPFWSVGKAISLTPWLLVYALTPKPQIILGNAGKIAINIKFTCTYRLRAGACETLETQARHA